MKSIDLNFKRLLDEPYALDKLFQSESYDWPGDWEGRALLAFLCHYEINGREIPHLHSFFKMIPEKTNRLFYFGKEFDGVTVDEQQLSGHNWYLRGLIKYAQLFKSDIAMRLARSTVEELYLPTIEWYSRYPLERGEAKGDVSGSVTGTVNGWRLSSDIGCAFMCVDGLAHYYTATRDERVKRFLDAVIDLFITVDLVKYKLQTHTTLTALRGILELYRTTNDDKYLRIVREKLDVYIAEGMTLTYENYNWFGRPDTWTEPCAVVDSFILASKLYSITSEERYKTLARRVWLNGLGFCQRANGGAGPNTCVTPDQPILRVSMYEAPFCCTMRYAEGLLEYTRNADMLVCDLTLEPEMDKLGRIFVDDAIMVKSGDNLVPIYSYGFLTEDDAKAAELKILN